MKPCQHQIDGTTICGQPSPFVAYVECIGELGPQSRTEDRCLEHIGTADVIDAWTIEEYYR